MTEQELVIKFREQYDRVTSIKETLDLAKSKLESTKQELLEMMESEDKDRTATYQDIGFVSIGKPKVRSYVKEENKDLLFSFLKKIGREESIKETVHTSTLNSIVSNLIEDGQEIPPFLNYFLQPNIKLYKK